MKMLLGLLAVASLGFSQPLPLVSGKEMSFPYNNPHSLLPQLAKLNEQHQLKKMLAKDGISNSALIEKVSTTIQCAKKHNTQHNNILTVIDYSLPSSEKRLWVFDLEAKKLLFRTYVSHGIKSGALLSKYFSNKNDSKASSIGVYNTEKTYYGRHGFALRLGGLDRGFNDNASGRSIVMHGGWYVEEDFIKKYGRAGRSWGCPAVPDTLTKPIINAIKENSLLVIYYPNTNWFVQSRFLNCDNLAKKQNMSPIDSSNQELFDDNRKEILFADLNKNNSREEHEPILVVSADNYIRLFQTRAPLKRMLRRQIDNREYIALSSTEFNRMIHQNNAIYPSAYEENDLNTVNFVVPEVKNTRGYYATEMKIVPMGKIKEVTSHTDSEKIENPQSYTVFFDSRPAVHLKSSTYFIRWLGL